MIRLVLLWLAMVSFSWAELRPDVLADACDLSGDVVFSRDISPGSDVDARRDAITLELSDHDQSCKGAAACQKAPIRQSLGEVHFYEVVTYSF